MQALGKQLDEGAHRDQRVADLVGDAGCQRAEDRQAIGACEQLARLARIVREALRGEHGADPGEQAARERSVRRREWLSTRRRQQREAGRSPRRGDRKDGAPWPVRWIVAHRHAEHADAAPRGNRDEPITSGVVGEHRGALQTEAASEELDDGLHGRVTPAASLRTATRTGASARHTQPPPPLPAGPSITPPYDRVRL